MVLVAEKAFRLITRSCLVSFLFYVGTQLHVQTTRNGRQLDEEPYCPHPVALFLFFIAQALLQASWLRKLFLSQPIPQSNPALLCVGDEEIALGPPEVPPQEVIVNSAQMAYIPFYIATNIFLACASEFWMYGRFAGSQVLLICGMASQLYAVFVLFSNFGRYSISRRNLLTHIVAKSFTGLGILYVWKGWGIIDNNLTPPDSELIQSAVICLLLTVASGPDPTLGLCMILDLIALFYGPGSSYTWRRAFMWNIGIITIAITVDIFAAKKWGIHIIRDDTSRPPLDHPSRQEDREVKNYI